jgi:hypothetical protein
LSRCRTHDRRSEQSDQQQSDLLSHDIFVLSRGPSRIPERAGFFAGADGSGLGVASTLSGVAGSHGCLPVEIIATDRALWQRLRLRSAPR